MPRGPEGCPTEPFPHPEDWHHAWIRPVFWLAFILPRAFPCKFMHSGVIRRRLAHSSGGCAGMVDGINVTGFPFNPRVENDGRHLKRERV